MANINFAKYLEAAFRHKLQKPDAPSFEYLGSSFPYETIFWYARNTDTALPSIYREPPNTEEGNMQMAKKVIETLDKHLDPDLDKYFHPVTGSIENSPTPETTQQTVAQTGVAVATAPLVSTSPIPRMPTFRPPTIPTPAPSVPEVFTKAFENEPEYKTDPTQFPPTSQFVNTAKTFGSNTQISAGKNLGRIGRGLANMAKGVGRGMAGGISTGLGAAAPSLGRAFNGALNGIGRITGPGGIGGGPQLPGFSPKSSKKVLWVFLGIFFLMVIGAGLLGGLPGNTPIGEASPIGPSDISNCKFTRSGDSQPIKSSILAGMITQTANNASVPPQILAGIAMHESPNFLQTQENTSEEITNNRFCNPGAVFCVNQALTENLHMGECTATDPVGSQNARAMGLMQVVDVHYPNVDLCNIQTNLSIAVKIFKDKLGSGSMSTEADVKKAVCAYYGAQTDAGCVYQGQYNYGQEVWTDYQNCQATGSTIGVSGCPAIGTISTPYGYNIPGYPEGVTNDYCGTLHLCHNGIDIAASEDTEVKSPIAGQVTIIGESNAKGKYVEIDSQSSDLAVTLEHLKTVIPKLNDIVSQNFPVGTMGVEGKGVTGPHVHYKITKGGIPINPLPTLGFAAEKDPVLKLFDKISDNDYNGVKPTSGNTNNWGKCNQ